MKCEICNKLEAETAITKLKDGEEQELYVCRACAAAERKNRQQKSQRTRKMTGLPPGMSITLSGNAADAPPPIIGAILDAVNGLVGNIEGAAAAIPKPSAEPEKKMYDFPLGRVSSKFRIGSYLHLEGLHVIGELDAVRRAVRALEMELVGIDHEGINFVGHVFTLRYSGSQERAKRVVRDLLAQERNARVRIFEDMSRIFADSVCRALAILKNCRMLAASELFDLLSPLRLAALEDLLDGITVEEIETILSEIDLSGNECFLDVCELDKLDSARADEANRRFEDVVLNERAEERFR